MKAELKCVVACAVCGLATAAGAQTGSFSLVPSISTLDTVNTNVFTLSLYGTADFGSHIAGGTVSLIASGTSTDAVQGMDAAAASWGVGGENDYGYGGDGNYTGLIFGQIIIPQFGLLPSPESAIANGPVLLGTFEVEISLFCGSITWQTAALDDNFALEVYDQMDQSSTSLFADDMNFGSATMSIIPAPSGLAVLGFGGLVAGRRQR